MTVGSPKTYRSDIDGLRTIAIAGVLLFHFRLGPFAGGYAGVDVFLVISGFLISSLLDAAHRANRFSLRDFFERRARRIIPALYVVLFLSCVASLQILPGDMKDVGSGLMSAAVFISNFFLSSLAQDYFAAGSIASQPELHTWSVSLEVQFYIVFAVLFAATRRNRPLLIATFVVLALGSFFASVFGTSQWPSAAFYLLPARLWEFLAGAAVYAAGRTELGRRLAEKSSAVAAFAPAVGVGLILLSYCLYSPRTLFPGWAAIAPCLGAMLIIAAGARQNFVTALLGARPLPQIGQLSYSAYLWHWPLLVFASYGRPHPLTFTDRLALLAATMLLAALSRLIVERPIIERRWFATPRAVGAFCCASGAGVVAFALLINLAGQKIIPIAVLSPEVLALANGQFDVIRRNCGRDDVETPPCRFGAEGAAAPPPTVLLWGNSYARMWLPGLDAAAKRLGIVGESLLLSNCPPLLKVALDREPNCVAFNRDVVKFLDAQPDIKTVVIGGDWDAWRGELAVLGPTIARISRGNRRVVFIMSPPPALYDAPRTLALAKLRGRKSPPLLPRDQADDTRSYEKAAVSAAQRVQPFDIVDPLNAFCDAARCQVEHDGLPLYYDQTHVSRHAASLFSGLFDAALQPKPPVSPDAESPEANSKQCDPQC
jgi:peptidoglycan/LPS O-acetylase OafA/YrhL